MGLAPTVADPRHPLHAFLGYWGLAPVSTAERLLARLLQHRGPNNWLIRSAHPNHFEPRQAYNNQDLVWQVASIGSATQWSTPKSPMGQDARGDGMLAGLAATWAATYGHPDGSPYPDAWVVTRGLSAPEGVQLTLGRDPFGRQPLYWIRMGDLLWFASHLTHLLPLLEDPSINLPALQAYSCFSFVPTPLTPLEGIASVSPGTEMIWQITPESDGLRPCSPRQLHDWREAEEQISSEAEAIVKVQQCLQRALSRQLAHRSQDEPIGVFLSGGLDSSIAAALLVQAGWTVRAYTLDLDDPRISEVGHAQQVAEALGIPLVRVRVTPDAIRQALPATVQALDLPYGDAVTIPFVLLAQVARQETSLIVNGEGGDQLFAGWTNKPLIAASVYAGGQLRSDALLEQYMRTFHRLWGLEEAIFQPAVAASMDPTQMLSMLGPALDGRKTATLLHRLRRASLMLKGGQNIQPRATAIAHHHGLAVCSPFCDLDLAQLSFAIAPSLLLQNACEKYILKRAVQTWLPAAIVWRAKRGMGLPLTRWCLNGLWSDFGHWLNPAVLQHQGHWNPDLPAHLVAGRVSGCLQGRRLGESLWLLLMWQRWRDHVLPSEPITPSWHHPFALPPWLWSVTQRCRPWR